MKLFTDIIKIEGLEKYKTLQNKLVKTTLFIDITQYKTVRQYIYCKLIKIIIYQLLFIFIDLPCILQLTINSHGKVTSTASQLYVLLCVQCHKEWYKYKFYSVSYPIL